MIKDIRKYFLPIIVLFVVAGVGTVFGIKYLTSQRNQDTVDQESNEPEIPLVPNEEVFTPAFINLQPTVDAWLASLSNNVNVGLMIYDLDNNQVAATHNPDEVFNSASIYKLFFVYDGYQQIDVTLDDPDQNFAYANDEFHQGYLSLSTCLDLMIRESYNRCADPMRSDPTRFARAEALANERLELTNTSSAGLYSTAADLAELLKLYYEHPDLSDDSWSKIQDSMLNQPKTTYEWRQGLPSGFQIANVYDKVGWNWTGSYWSIFNDAAIVEFPAQNRHYIMVVMTEYLTSSAPLVELGEQLETTIISESNLL